MQVAFMKRLRDRTARRKPLKEPENQNPRSVLPALFHESLQTAVCEGLGADRRYISDGSGRQVVVKPARGMKGSSRKGAWLFETVMSAGYNLHALFLRSDQVDGVKVDLDDVQIMRADNQQGWREHVRQ